MKLKEVKIGQQFRVKELEDKGGHYIFTIRSKENNGCEIWAEFQEARSYWDNETEVELVDERNIVRIIPEYLGKYPLTTNEAFPKSTKEIVNDLKAHAQVDQWKTASTPKKYRTI